MMVDRQQRPFIHTNGNSASPLLFIVKTGDAAFEPWELWFSASCQDEQIQLGLYGVAALVGILFEDGNSPSLT